LVKNLKNYADSDIMSKKDIHINLDKKASYLLEDILYLNDIIDGNIVYSAYPTSKKTEFELLDDKGKQKKQGKLMTDFTRYLIQESKLNGVKVLDIWPFGAKSLGDPKMVWGLNIFYEENSQIYQVSFNIVGPRDNLSIEGNIVIPPEDILNLFKNKKS
jgi:hypothetical protein